MMVHKQDPLRAGFIKMKNDQQENPHTSDSEQASGEGLGYTWVKVKTVHMRTQIDMCCF